jgi:hypothetical protein
MQLETYFVVFIVGHGLVKLLSDQAASLVGPGAGNIAHSIATATKDEGGQAEALDVVDTVGVALHAEVEASKSIAGQRVGTALEDDGLGLVELHDVLDDGLKDGLVRLVVDAVAEREVDRVVLAAADADVAKLAGTGEVLAVLVEGDSHDAICGVESLLNAVAMMDIDVDVEDALLEAEELKDAEHNVCTSQRKCGGDNEGGVAANHSHSRSHWPRSSLHGEGLQPN